MKKDSIRQFILVTLSHCENRSVTPEEVCIRFQQLFSCLSIIVAVEKHMNSGRHLHVAVLNQNASKNNATKRIREALPEFEGRQCSVKFHKGWNTICSYVTKEDREPFIWGIYSKEQILAFAKNVENKRKALYSPTSQQIVEKLHAFIEWEQVYEDPTFTNTLLLRYQNCRRIFDDLQFLKIKRSTVSERIVQYLTLKGWPEEYSPEQILEKYVLLDWIACQLVFQRPIKTKQLFIYGEPSSQKSLLIQLLAKVLRVYFASSRINDFAGADNLYDLWVFDEFHDTDDMQGAPYNQNLNCYTNTLLKVLDGQECRLDSKYGRVFNKTVNVPIIMIANKLTYRVKTKGPMQERFLRLRFSSNIPNLREERIVATLWGCMQRRFSRQLELRGQIPYDDILIQYNELFLDRYVNAEIDFTQERDIHNFRETLPHLFLNVSKQIPPFRGDIYHQTPDPKTMQNLEFCDSNRKQTIFYIPFFESSLEKLHLSLLNFALIPLKKQTPPKQITTFLNVFSNQSDGALFQLLRNESMEETDFLVWPVHALFADSQGQSLPNLGAIVYMNADDLGSKKTPIFDGRKTRFFTPQDKLPKHFILQLGVPGRDFGPWDESD